MLSDYLAEKKNVRERAWILACGFRFTWETLLWIFFSLGCSLLLRYYVCKQPSVFQAASFGDLLLKEKQKKPFVSLTDQVTITQSFFTAASLAQVDNALNGADSNLFCRDTRGFNSRSVKCSLFCSVFLLLSKPFFVSLWLNCRFDR